MRAGGRQRSWSARPTGTLTCMTRRSTRRFAGCGARRDESQPAAAALPGAARGPGWAGPAGAADRADRGARLRSAVPRRRDPDPGAAPGFLVGVPGARLRAAPQGQHRHVPHPPPAVGAGPRPGDRQGRVPHHGAAAGPFGLGAAGALPDLPRPARHAHPLAAMPPPQQPLVSPPARRRTAGQLRGLAGRPGPLRRIRALRGRRLPRPGGHTAGPVHRPPGPLPG